MHNAANQAFSEAPKITPAALRVSATTSHFLVIWRGVDMMGVSLTFGGG